MSLNLLSTKQFAIVGLWDATALLGGDLHCFTWATSGDLLHYTTTIHEEFSQWSSSHRQINHSNWMNVST